MFVKKRIKGARRVSLHILVVMRETLGLVAVT